MRPNKARLVTRQALIVDSGLAATAGAAARSVQNLATELRGRGIEVIEAISYEDGLATCSYDATRADMGTPAVLG